MAKTQILQFKGEGHFSSELNIKMYGLLAVTFTLLDYVFWGGVVTYDTITIPAIIIDDTLVS